jgi:hypothetical protein
VTQPAPIPATVTRLRARNTFIRTVRTALKGKGLDIRERDRELVITYPHHPEHGRIHINLASGEASHTRTIWTYLGHVDGHCTSHDPDDTPAVDADLITAILTQPDTLPAHRKRLR